jgi:hypothetical protein
VGGGVCLFVYIAVTGPRQGRMNEPRIETRKRRGHGVPWRAHGAERYVFDKGHPVTSFGHGTNLDGGKPLFPLEAKRLLSAMHIVCFLCMRLQGLNASHNFYYGKKSKQDKALQLAKHKKGRQNKSVFFEKEQAWA